MLKTLDSHLHGYRVRPRLKSKGGNLWERGGRGATQVTEHLLLESSTQETSGSSYIFSPKEWGVPVGIRKNPQLSWGDVTL